MYRHRRVCVVCACGLVFSGVSFGFLVVSGGGVFACVLLVLLVLVWCFVVLLFVLYCWFF